MTRNEAHLLNGRSVSLIVALALTCAAVALLAAVSPVRAALADDEQTGKDPTTMTAYELQLQIEDAQQDYAAARDDMEKVDEAIAENRSRIEELEESIPAQQKRSSEAARKLYKIQQEGVGIVDLLLSADSLHDFLIGFEYMSYVADENIREMNRLEELKQQIASAQSDLQKTYAEANARADEALKALEGLQEAQAEVQRRIEEEARMAAEIAAQAAALAETPRNNDEGAAAAPQQSGEAAAEQAPAAAPAANNAPDPSLSADEASFLAEWTPRIDAYLAGSPLAGQGATFARAAYEYGVDPRWSPAISFTESSKGLACFNSHNAWGWGSESWDSWEEAIFDHVRGLSRGYGYTISVEAAQKYCPPNWQMWYDRTSSQMEMI